MRHAVWLLFLSLCASGPQDRNLDIRVRKDNWGSAGIGDIRAVLRSSAGVLWAHFPERTLTPIEVGRGNSGPITYYKRGRNGEYRVRLDVNGTFWAQFSYQFAHEFCHILCNYDEDQDPNEWFEEMLCEVASLYALRRMAETWKEKAPYPNWRGYSKSLRSYADNRMKGAPLPEGATLASYYSGQEKALRGNKELRKVNTIIACRLLPLFEKEPDQWAAVGWINTEPAGKDTPFKAYLSAWRRHAPEQHRDFITRIARAFEISLET